MERAALSGAALFIKKTAQKHGWASVSVSIAGLSESGVNAEHTGKSCSRLELVVRECGLMLQGMVSVFLFDCLAFYESAEFVPTFRGPGKWGGKIRSLYTGIHGFLSAKAAFRPEYTRYTRADKEIESFHGELPDFSLHTFILHKHPLLTTSLLKTYQSLMRKPRAHQ